MASQASNPWIGNFRSVHAMNRNKGFRGYAASGRRTPRYKFSKDNKTLKCKGMIVDTIKGIDGAKDGRRNRAALSRKKASAILGDLSRTLVLDREDKYLNRPCLPGHFYHDLREFCIAAIKHPENVPDSFFRWFRLNRGLVIQGHPVEEICERSLKRPKFEKKDQSVEISTRNQFFSRFEDRTQNMGKMLVTTKDDRIGMAPKRAQKGDKICVLLGCNIPLVLRKKMTLHGDRTTSYEVIGECYLDGFMDGEAIEAADAGYLEYENFCLV